MSGLPFSRAANATTTILEEYVLKIDSHTLVETGGKKNQFLIRVGITKISVGLDCMLERRQPKINSFFI
jgi:hypothetical protein